MHPHDTVFRPRAAKHVCDVCQSFAPDDTGRCPLCAPAASGRSGDVVHDLVAHRDGAA